MSEIKFKVTSEADASGFKKAGVAIDDLTVAGKRAAVSIGNVEQQAVRFSRLSEKLGKFMRVMFDPLLLGIGAAYLAIGKLVEKMREIDEALKPSKYTSFADVWKAYGNAVLEAKVSAEAFDRQMQKLGQSTESTSAKTERLLELTRNNARLQAELTDRKKAVELATVDAAEKRGAITPEDAIAQRAAIEDKFEREKAARDLESAQRELSIRKMETDAILQGLPAREQELKLIQSRRSALGSDEQDSAYLATLEAQKAASKERLKRLTDASHGVLATLGLGARKLSSERIAEIEQAGLLDSRISDFTEAQPGRMIDRRLADAELADKMKAIQAARERYNEGLTAIATGKEVLSQNARATPDLLSESQRARSISLQAATSASPSDVAFGREQVAAGIAAGSGSGTSRIQDLVRQVATNNIEESSQQLAGIIQAMTEVFSGFNMTVSQLRREVENFKTQSAANRE